MVGYGDATGWIDTQQPDLLSRRLGDRLHFLGVHPSLRDGHSAGFNDAFTATLEQPSGVAPPSAEVNTQEGSFALTTGPSPELGLHIKRAKNGELTLLVETPGPGGLVARASGTILKVVGKKTRKRRVTLAQATGVARSEGTTTLTLRLSSKYAKTLKSVRKLKALITVNFTPPAPGESLLPKPTRPSSESPRPRPLTGQRRRRRASSPELRCRLASQSGPYTTGQPSLVIKTLPLRY